MVLLILKKITNRTTTEHHHKMTSKGIVFDLDAANSDSTTAYDKSRYKTTGTVTAALPVEKGYYFNGSTAQIPFTTVSQLQIARSLITLIAWIKSANAAEMAILDKCDDGDTPTLGYALRTSATGTAVFTTNTDEYDSTVSIVDSKPHFIAGVLDGTNKFIVVDDKGSVTKAYSTAITDSAKNLGVGYQVNPEIRFTGTIYFARIYNVGLNFGQLMDIYNSTKHKYL